MKIKLWRKILLGLTFVSIVIAASVITWKIVQKNNLEVQAKTTSGTYKPINIQRSNFAKLMDYHPDNTYVFNLPNVEYFLVNKTLSLYPELANKNFKFSVDNISRPKHISLSIDTKSEINWFYSII